MVIKTEIMDFRKINYAAYFLSNLRILKIIFSFHPEGLGIFFFFFEIRKYKILEHYFYYFMKNFGFKICSYCVPF